MNELLAIQVLISAIVGGVFVAAQSLIAERVPQKVAALVIAIPSTFAIALLFMSLSLSPSAVASAVPAIPASIGMGMVFVTAYVYLAQYIRLGRLVSAALCGIGAVSIWFLFAAPIAYFKLNNFVLSLAIYGVIFAASYYLLAVRPKIETTPIRISYTTLQKLGRAVFGGLIIGLIVFLAKILGPFWGAVFSAFPAVFLATLLIIHFGHGRQFLYHVTRSFPIATPIFIIYALVVQYTYPHIGVVYGTIAAYAVCILYPITITLLLNKKKAT